MNARTLAIDVGIAALVAVLVLIVSPGPAITVVIVGLACIVCGASMAIDAGRRRRRRRAARALR
jgi:hypothetical protein